jgi:hypothetical protein
MDILRMSKIDFLKKLFAKNRSNFQVGNKPIFEKTKIIPYML